MNTLNTMPGFTAEASVYKTDGRYAGAATGAASATMVVPQIPLGLCTKAAYYGDVPPSVEIQRRLG